MPNLDLSTAQRAALVNLIADLRSENGYYATAGSKALSYETFSAIHAMLGNVKLSTETCNILLAILGDTDTNRIYSITSQRAAADEIEKALSLDAKDDTVKDEELPYLLEEEEKALHALARQLGNGHEKEQLINVRYIPLITAIGKIYDQPSLSDSTRTILRKIKQYDAARSLYPVFDSPAQRMAATEIMKIVDAIRRVNSSDEELWDVKPDLDATDDELPYLQEEEEEALSAIVRMLENEDKEEQALNVRSIPLSTAMGKISKQSSLSESTRNILRDIIECHIGCNTYMVNNSPAQRKAAEEIINILNAVRRINSSTEAPSDANPDTESSDLTAEERRHLHGLCWALLVTDATLASVATEVRKPLTSALAKEVAHYGLDSDKGPLLAALGYALDHELRITIPAGSTQYDLLRAVADELTAG